MSTPAPDRLWENALHAIDLSLEHPHAAHFMPKALIASSGLIAFPASLDTKWLEYLASTPNKALLPEQKREEYLYFLQHPDAAPVAAHGYSASQRKSFKHVAKRDFELGDGLPHVYRQSVTNKKGKKLPPKYAACENDAFRIIANTHSQFNHEGITKTMADVAKCYHGITEKNVKWVIDQCAVCSLNRGNKTKPIIKPIVSEGCLNRIQIDLMDFREGPLLLLVWLYPLAAKTAAAVAACMDEWFMYNGYPLILHCDNGNEFKGELITLCKEVGVKIINGQPYRPQTQGSVESANNTFKRRLTALQTQDGTHEWVKYLKRIALALNTTRHNSLEADVSPYEVHFGRPSRWTFRGPAAVRPGGFEEGEEEETEAEESNGDAAGAADLSAEGSVVSIDEEEKESEVESDIGEEDKAEEIDAAASCSEEEVESNAEDHLSSLAAEEGNADHSASSDGGYESAVDSQFTALEQAQLKHKDHRNQLLLERQVRQNTVVFMLTEIVTLLIPAKMRAQGESRRLPVRIYSKPYENGYILISQWGRLRGCYPHEHLNKESEETQLAVGAAIPYGHLEMDDGIILPLITLTKAVQHFMGRGTIGAGQRNGRKHARTANPSPALPRKRVRPYKRRGPRQPQLSLEELGLIDPRLTDAAQAAEAARSEAARLQAAAAHSSRKPGWDIVPVLQSSDEEFEEPPIIPFLTRSQRRAHTEPLA